MPTPVRLLVCVGALLAPALASAAAKRPNVLFMIADDWGWPHAGAYGDREVKTPNFDRVAREGTLFNNAFSAAPSCSPSRAAILTGQHPHRLAEGGNLWGFLPSRFAVYPDLLEKAGYVVGLQGKGWGPGDFKAGGRTRNPAGPSFKTFAEFFATVPAGKPFAFWFGSSDPHRPYDAGTGKTAGHRPENVRMPPYWVDAPEIRDDVLDYYFEIERFDRDVGDIMRIVQEAGRLDDTMVAITADNGMPFPRCKANVYGCGSHQPLAIRWPGVAKAGQTTDAFVNLMDLAPTFLEAAGMKALPDMTGRSLLSLLRTGKDRDREQVFIERERHANVRKGDAGYPVRAVRTGEFLYIRNMRPDRWPAGDPEPWKDPGRSYGDVDGSPTKDLLLARKAAPSFDLAFAKRPAEELYDLKKDPFETKNLADDPAFAAAKKKLAVTLDRWMRQTKDPRVDAADDRFDAYPYFGTKKK